ncbi:hypothetical protein F7734_43130 [Scytonema sp. UIC 10036]|uniref:hypothetical protein n=1 Tax=Scytonema sp. UIC 10036 TaxID=2304196 RepID=UPI0012DA7AA7|nr:hypothetical protein [Scytonema sp. UIC 10036]MUG98727.1 hypothetical protein [Scytonema sp. UIC 10036]
MQEFKDALLALTEEEPEVPALPADKEEPETEEAEPTPPNDGPVVEVAAEVVSADEPVETPEEAQEDCESTAEIDLPSPDAIASMKKPDLVAWLKRCELPSGGTVREMRSRLNAHVISYRNPNLQAA